jgi:hypothetical protein
MDDDVRGLSGGVAQLGERMAGSHQVAGSIPVISTEPFSNLRFTSLSVPSPKCGRHPLLLGSAHTKAVRQLPPFTDFGLDLGNNLIGPF